MKDTLVENRQIWLVDATSYKKTINNDLLPLKKRFYALKAIARKKRIGNHTPPGSQTFSNGLLRIGTILKQNGYYISFFSIEAIKKRLQRVDSHDIPDIVAFGCICPTVPVCAEIARKIKKIKPESFVAIGGAQAFFSPRLINERFPIFDEIIIDSDVIAASKLVGKKLQVSLTGEEDYLDYTILPLPLSYYSLNLSTCHGCRFGCAYCLDKFFPCKEFSLNGNISALLGKIPREQ